MNDERAILLKLKVVEARTILMEKSAHETRMRAARPERQSRMQSAIGTTALLAGLTIAIAPKASPQFGMRTELLPLLGEAHRAASPVQIACV